MEYDTQHHYYYRSKRFLKCIAQGHAKENQDASSENLFRGLDFKQTYPTLSPLSQA